MLAGTTTEYNPRYYLMHRVQSLVHEILQRIIDNKGINKDIGVYIITGLFRISMF